MRELASAPAYGPPAKKPAVPADSDTDLRVYVKIRPVLAQEEPAAFDTKGGAAAVGSLKAFTEQTFPFARVLDETTGQSAVFEQVAAPLLARLAQGVDGLLLVCGAANSGKTFTVHGTTQHPGLLPRIISSLLDASPPRGANRVLLGSCAEIDNHRVIDLLAKSRQQPPDGRLPVGTRTAAGLSEFEISKEDIANRLREIDTARRECNSHFIMMLKLVTFPINQRTGRRTGNPTQIKRARLSVVELAATSAGPNRSLAVLRHCIRRLINPQLPDRAQRFTEMFRCLFETGNRLTNAALIINVSSSPAQLDQTISSLRSAAEAVKGDTDDDLRPRTIDLNDDEGEESQCREATRRQEVQTLKKMQEEYQMHLEELTTEWSRAESVLWAEKLQSLESARELRRERDRERARADELQQQLREANERIQTLERQVGFLREKEEKMDEKNREAEARIAFLEGELGKFNK
jgi:hypothetical protein